jgi:glycosyltransferase involved in cell wall biosynthesis
MKFIFSILCPTFLIAKTLIITHNYNRPDFIEMQYKTLKKFIQDDFEYVVFNDANNSQMQYQIDQMCNQYNIKCIHIPQEFHVGDANASYRHATGVRYALEEIGFEHEGIVFILDCDIILLRPFSVEKYMQDKDIAARINRPLLQATHLSPLFCILNMNTLPDKKMLSFDCVTINGLLMDTGGASHYYLLQHPKLRVEPIQMVFSHQLFLADKHINKVEDTKIPNDVKFAFYAHYGFNQNEIDFLLKKPDTFEFYLNQFFLHYRGSSYTNDDTYKLKIFKEFVEILLRT